MKIINLLCAENIIRDVQSNQVVVYNLLDSITADGFPFLFPKIAIYYFAYKEDGDHEVYELDLAICNNETEVFKGDIKVTFSNRLKNRGIVRFNGIILRESGVITVRIKTKEGEILKESIVVLNSIQNPPIAQEV